MDVREAPAAGQMSPELNNVLDGVSSVVDLKKHHVSALCKEMGARVSSSSRDTTCYREYLSSGYSYDFDECLK